MVSLPELIKSNNIARFKLDKRGTGWDDRMRLLLLSDTHISRTSDRFSVDILKKGIKQVNQLKNVDFVLHLGDITDNGTKSDYLYANELFDLLDPTLKENMFFIPGNHDVKNVGDRLYEEFITPKRSFTIELPNDSVIIGLDSTEPDQDQGEIGFRTTKLFKQIIEQYSGLKIVCFHHQLVPIPKTGRERSAVNDAGNVLKMLLETNVNLVLNGHRHITNLYNLSDGEGELMIFNAGTMSCLKTRFHQLWTYTIIDIEPEEVTFRINCIDDTSRKMVIGRPFFARVRQPAKLNDSKVIASIVHMSNTDFSSTRAHDAEAWARAVDMINTIDCDLVVHTGSLVGSSYELDFELASAMLENLDHPLLVVPGLQETHYPMSWEFFQEYVGPLEPVYENDSLLVIGINSCQLQTKSGVIGRRVLNKTLERAVHALTEKIVAIALHHDMVPTPHERWESTLNDAGDSLSLFALSGIDLIMSGHSFTNWSVQVENAIFTSPGSVSSRKANLYSKDGNTFNVIRIHDNGTTTISEMQVLDEKERLKRIFKIPILM